MSKPRASRPHIPGYGIPEETDSLLDWAPISERVGASKNYWLATITPKGRPHVNAIWGVWLDERLYFGGGPDVLWARSLKADPHLVAHLESGDEAVILEGEAHLESEDDALLDRVIAAYKEKYDLDHPPPFWRFRPHKAFAWTDLARDPTRWHFD